MLIYRKVETFGWFSEQIQIDVRIRFGCQMCRIRLMIYYHLENPTVINYSGAAKDNKNWLAETTAKQHWSQLKEAALESRKET